MTKTVLETALDAELTDHLGHEHGETPMGSNMRNGTRPNTALTEIGSVQIEVPGDRQGSFEPVIVRKRKRRLDRIDEIVLSLTARGLTTGEIAAHFNDVYGATVSKDTIGRITEKVTAEMTEWASRPLDPIYPVIFVDAFIHVGSIEGSFTGPAADVACAAATVLAGSPPTPPPGEHAYCVSARCKAKWRMGQR